jgi:hypothetical protein
MELFRLLGKISIDNTEAKKALDETTTKAKSTSAETGKSFQAIGKAALTIGKGILAAGATIGGAWIAAIEGSREYRTEMGKLDTAFVVNGHSSDAAKKTYQDLQAVLGETDVSVEAANHLAVMTDNEKDLQTWTNICTGVFATFGDSLPIEGLTEAANETAKVGEVTGPLADALNWAGISEDEFNDKLAKCSNEQERQKLIMETLNSTYKSASDQYKATNADVMAANRAQERLNGAMAELGRVGEPILTAVKNAAAGMVETAVPKIESFIQKIKDMRKWMKENKTTVDIMKAGIVAATVAIAGFVAVMGFSSAMKKASAAIKLVTVAMKALNVAMKANVIGLVITLIASLVAGFLYLWKNNEGFRAFWISLWAKLKAACSTAISGIKSAFNGLKSAWNTVRDVFGKIASTIKDKIESAKSSVKSAVDKIKGFFKFKWSLPKLKVPSFTIKGKFDLKSLSVPKIGLKWNAEGGILTEPTIFGMTGNTLLGGGEAGAEAIAPIDTLQSYVRTAVRDETDGIRETIIAQTRLLMDLLRRIIPQEVTLDSGALVGALTPSMDMRMADKYRHALRGNTR